MGGRISYLSQEFPTDLEGYRERLRTTFGYPDLRDGQEQVLAGLAETDVLGVMPTGSGKSLCYVLPALEVGRTLVVSPLIALMHDQVRSLTQVGVGAAFLNSSVSSAEKNARYRDFVEGRIPLLYMAPEGLRNAKLIAGLRRHGVNLLAIDEAHCISQWGHDFRPDYLTLGEVREQLGSPRLLALTATADPRVRADIAARLGLSGAMREVVTSFDRPNLDLTVARLDGVRRRIDWVVGFAREHAGQSGIVYVRTRSRTQEVAAALVDGGVRAEAYHAGLPQRQRTAVQDRFDAGETPVIVATNAFGMGVDKPDVRYVIHFNLPGRIEAYYQEAGRAGRDGEPAECVLLYAQHDRAAQQWFINEAHPNDDRVREVWSQLLVDTDLARGDGRLEDVVRPSDQANNVLGALRASGLVAPAALHILSRDPDARIDTRAIAEHRADAETRLARMVEYATTKRCRRAVILGYFGEAASARCENCDNCRPSAGGGRGSRADASGRDRREAPADDLGEGGEVLAAELRAWRLARARADGVPAYVVFGNQTLQELVRRRPRSQAALLQVEGIGRVRAERYGRDLLAVFATQTESATETGGSLAADESLGERIRTVLEAEDGPMYARGIANAVGLPWTRGAVRAWLEQADGNEVERDDLSRWRLRVRRRAGRED